MEASSTNVMFKHCEETKKSIDCFTAIGSLFGHLVMQKNQVMASVKIERVCGQCKDSNTLYHRMVDINPRCLSFAQIQTSIHIGRRWPGHFFQEPAGPRIRGRATIKTKPI